MITKTLGKKQYHDIFETPTHLDFHSTSLNGIYEAIKNLFGNVIIAERFLFPFLPLMKADSVVVDFESSQRLRTKNTILLIREIMR